MTGEVVLAGCGAEPLGSYLKALGVFRLVAEQADPGVVGCWQAGTFVLRGKLDRAQLVQFFLAEYRPTPVVSPWNNSSGFGPEGSDGLAMIEASPIDRLGAYRETITKARALLVDPAASGWDKATMVAACRSRLPDAALDWLDAAVVLTDEDAVFPPLLGTGGNDGRLEFSRNFHQRLVEAIGVTVKRIPNARQTPSEWLQDALFATGRSAALKGSAGQFDPGGAGGSNSSPLGKAESLVNPWDYVLLVEGSVLFASGASRRLATGARGRAAMPFTVDASPAGYPSAADENNRGELWAPLWSQPAQIGEVRRLFAEGKAEWRGRRAASGVDLVKATASLGVDRGVGSFARYVFVERFGLSTVAVPVGQVDVRQRREAPVLADLDGWLEQVRRGPNPPAAVRTALRSVDQAVFDLARTGGAPSLQAVLVAAARLELAVGRATSFRSKDTNPIGPLPGLSSERWLPALLGAASAELRLAVCLSSMRDVDDRGRTTSCLRWLLRPIAQDERGRLVWTEATAVEGLGSRPVPDLLAEALTKRVLQASDRHRHTGDNPDAVGVVTRFDRDRPAPLADVVSLAASELDLGLLADLVVAALLLDWRSPWRGQFEMAEQSVWPVPALGVLGAFYAKRTEKGPVLLSEATWPAQLAAHQVSAVLAAGLRRLRIAGAHPMALDPATIAATAPSGPLLAAALLCPLSAASGQRLLRSVAPPPAEPPARSHAGNLTEEDNDQP